MPVPWPVTAVDPEPATDALVEAFRDYPVMQFVLGARSDYDSHLRRLVRFFVTARELRGEPILGIADPGTNQVVAATIVTLPDIASPPKLVTARATLWAALGADARARYEAYSAVAGQVHIADRHHHLNMLGVRRAYRGRGLASRLVAAVCGIADADRASTGVSLSTEDPANVALYTHLGFREIGRARADQGPEAVVMFRSRGSGSPTT